MSDKPAFQAFNAKQLRSIIERVEKLEEEKANTMMDIKEVFAEAKSNGLNPKILKQVIKIRKLDSDERFQQEAELETYLAALGMIPEKEAA